MSRPRLFRRRFIPDENIELKDDMILALEPNLIITSWNVLKPRRDISRGVSAYFIDKGIKVSKVFDNAGQMVYWYCDIIETHYDEKENIYTFNDLLIDVVVYPDGQVEVLDMDEFADAMGNDLNTSQAVTVLYDVLKADTNDATKRALVGDFDSVLSLDLLKEQEEKTADDGLKAMVEDMIAKRNAARKEKDFAAADAIRDELLSKGIEIKDTREGTVWKLI